MDVDIAVLGSGFAGSLFAMAARKLGFSVALLERGTHPRFAVGESTTPLTNLLLEELCARYGLERIAPLTKWSSWQRAYPELGCGLKRGFSFFFEQLDGPACTADEALLFAASPHDTVADTHWLRADVDAFLVSEARACGVEYLEATELISAEEREDAVLLTGQRAGAPLSVCARFVVDASGPAGALSRLLGLGTRELSAMPQTAALYTHFAGVRELDEISGAPYPVDQAAVHHVFDGGWAWVLRFSNGVTSAGIIAEHARARELGLARGESAWNELLTRLPALAKQFGTASAVQPWTLTPEVCFRAAQVVGRRWALLPSAAGFVDPLLSSGFPLTLLGVQRLASLLGAHWETARLPDALDDYAACTGRELLAVAELVGAMYANFSRPCIFRALCLLYFAAATYAESARRLDRPERARGFLLCDEPLFWGRALPLMREARAGVLDGAAWLAAVHAVLEPFDVAGLGKLRNPPWYPVEAEDLLASAGKLGTSRAAAAAMLARCGFSASAL